jgi:hypothetical protein
MSSRILAIAPGSGVPLSAVACADAGLCGPTWGLEFIIISYWEAGTRSPSCMTGLPEFKRTR